MNDKTIGILGATGAVGEPMSRFFHTHGANVVLGARTENTLNVLSGSLGMDRVLAIRTDASKSADVLNFFERAKEKFGGLDALLIAVGEWHRLDISKSIDDAVAIIKADIDQHLMTSMVAGYVAQEIFREQGDGLILFMGSHAALKPELPRNLSYGTVKAAELAYAERLRYELQGTGVRVCVLMPAIINTKHLENRSPEDRARAVQPETIVEWIADNINNAKIEFAVPFKSTLELE